MKMFPRSLVQSIACSFHACVLLILLCAGMPAWADPEAFEVRASPAFVGREAFCQTTGVNLGAFAYARDGNDTISEGSYASLANAEFDPTAEDAPESYTFTCNGWTATVSLATMVQRRDSHVVALSFSPPAGQNNPTLDLLVADAYATHALALVQVVNGTPVATALSVGEKFWINPSLSFTRATVPFDPTLTFRVVDGNTGARGPFGSTLVADAWTDGPGNDAFRAVTFYLDASESGLRYTLHSQASGPEILRSLVAVQCSEAQQGQQTIGDFTTEDETGAVCITGFVPIGGYYWVTRDLDGACIESRMLDPNLSYPTPLQWSLRGQHALPPPMQVITLHVAATNGSALSIHQDSAERSVTLADETVYVIEDYDAWGNPHPFYYRNFTATVNMRETWWLMQGSTQSTPGTSGSTTDGRPWVASRRIGRRSPLASRADSAPTHGSRTPAAQEALPWLAQISGSMTTMRTVRQITSTTISGAPPWMSAAPST